MSRTFEQLREEVEDILSDDAFESLDTSNFVNRSIVYISNFFQNLTISEFNPSQSGYYLDVPTGFNRVSSIFINEDALESLENWEIKKIQFSKEDGVMRYYNIDSSKIYLTFSIKTTDDVRIAYYKNFTELVTDESVTDVPDKYIPLLVTGAVYFYYSRISSLVYSAREEYPDVNPTEITQAREFFKQQFDDMLKAHQLEL